VANIYEIHTKLIRKTEAKRLLGRKTRKWQDNVPNNTKQDAKVSTRPGSSSSDKAVVRTVMSLEFTQKRAIV
jgi:hypothetical protein